MIYFVACVFVIYLWRIGKNDSFMVAVLNGVPSEKSGSLHKECQTVFF